MKLGKLLTILLAGYLTIQLLFFTDYLFIDNANLLFHEAGHLLTLSFGKTIHFLGGTFFQLLIPLICLAVFIFKEQNFFGAGFCTWWYGENLVNVAYYMKDAPYKRLFLVGGGQHDWAYLFNKFGLIDYSQIIGNTTLVLGFATMFAAIAFMIFLIFAE